MSSDHTMNEWAEYRGHGFSVNPHRRNRPLSLDVHSWSLELEKVLTRSGIRSIALYSWEHGGPGLSFLAKFAEQIQFLELLDKSITDRSVINALVNLEALSIEGAVDDLNFSSFVGLQTCMIEDAPSSGNVGACPALQDLTLRNVKKFEDFAPFASLHRLTKLLLDAVPLRSLHYIERLQTLRELHLAQCRRLDTLEGIEGTHIEELWLDYNSRLRSIAPLTKLSSLRKLEIGSCKQIEDLECIAENSSLETLWIMTGREIPSLAFLRDMKNLRDFRTFGTKIVDGNLSILLELPKLEQVVIHRHMRHYSHTEEQLNAQLQARRQAE